MGHKVDISEVIEFSNDFSTASESLKTQLKEVEKNIERLQSMESFSGEAASNAKNYFSELHLTILKSFEHLLTDLKERLEKHLTVFESTVDSSDSAIVKSGYLSTTESDIDETYESFIEEQEKIRQALADVSDISSASHPSTLTFNSTYDKVNEAITKLEEDFDRYTRKDIENASEIEQLHEQIETTISDSGEVTEDNEFIYFMGSATPDSLLDLQGHNQGKQKEMIAEAKDSRDRAIADMDYTSGKVASQALRDLENGVIDEEEYYSHLEELRKLHNAEDVDEEVSRNFIDYLQDNRSDISEGATTGTLTGVVGEMINESAKDKFTRAELIKAMSGGKPGAGSFMNNRGLKIQAAGDYVSGAFTAFTLFHGIHDDYTNTDKTIGEASSKNVASTTLSTLATMGGSAGMGLFFGGAAATPVGWAVIGGVVAGTAVTTGFNYMYDNNIIGTQDFLDGVGAKLDNAGEAINGFFSDAYSWVTG